MEAIEAASVGVVVRNHCGQVFFPPGIILGLVVASRKAELRASLSDLYIGMTLDMPVILETDCSFVASVSGRDCGQIIPC